jgi:hypothetical protein
VALRKKGDDAGALALFEQAYAAQRSPRAAAQMALAHQALGHWARAEENLVEALGAVNDAWIDRNRPYLEESLVAVRRHLGWLEVTSNVTGAEVRVEAELVGRLPLDHPLRVAAGDFTVEVRAPGYAGIQRSVHVDPGARALAAFEFVARAAASEAPERDVSRVPSEASYGHEAAWMLFGGAGALLLVGIGGAVTREWEARIYNDDSQCGPSGGLSRSARCGTNRDIGSAAETVAIVALAGAGLAAAAGGALLFFDRRRPGPTPAARAFGCGVVSAGVVCDGAF